ncbi:DUF4179 domain-containing protein [Paenibacillus fonticola]|uniref:DUF4179 domain-containing protein n=1 Tax=Paenibacillus fonticola TaxID=379896 RepID=UPI00036A38C9|nr:DUF4179 domain-containing protein [Paenibacillus fonticola]
MKIYDLDKKLREIGREELNEVPEIIRQRQDQVYASLPHHPIENKTGHNIRSRIMRKFIVATAAAVILVFIGGLSGVMMSPALANSLKNLPLISNIFKLVDDLGLQTAEEQGLVEDTKASVTHEGVTLHVPQVIFDGLRLSLAVQREGDHFPSAILDSEVVGEGENAKVIHQRGEIKDFKMFINGKPTHEYKGNQRIGLSGLPTEDPHSAIFQMTAHSGPGESAYFLPDHFTLTAQFWLEGTKEPFVFELPVRKQTKATSFSPKETRSWNNVAVTLDEIQFTPLTTKVTLNLEPEDGSREVYQNLIFELWDGQGNPVNIVGGMGTFGEAGESRSELLFDRFKEAPSTVTLKAFVPQMADPSAKTGQFKLDQNGEPVKHYLKELEMSVQVNQNEIEKLYNLSK